MSDELATKTVPLRIASLTEWGGKSLAFRRVGRRWMIALE
jgi:hypothetical protein